MNASTAAATPHAGAPPAATAIRALGVLDAIGESDGPLRFGELTQITGLSKATLHRMLAALMRAGFVSFDAETGTYWLGMRIVDLASKLWDSLDLRNVAEPELARLRQMSGQTAQLGVLDGMHVVYLDERAPLQEVRMFYNAGRRLPAHCTAIGKAILAFLPEHRRHDVLFRHRLTSYTSNTLTSLPALEQDFALIRERSYAIDDEELELGRRCVAAPVFEHGRQPLAAIGITGPAEELTLKRCHELSAEVLSCAELLRPTARAVQSARAVRSAQSAPSAVRCLQPGAAFLGDSPIWCGRQSKLYWVDIVEPAIHVFDPAAQEDRARVLPSLVGAIALRDSGGLVLALQSGFHLLDREDGALTPLGDPEAHLPRNRFNDGTCDRAGRFWAGTMSMAREIGAAGLYRLDPGGTITRMDAGFSLCNGIDWSPDDRTMYLVDTVQQVIFAYDFELAEGSISNRRIFARMPETKGALGGLAVDVEGGVWTPLWDGGALVRFDPAGHVERTLELPVPRPTGLCFGGPDNATLFVTSARLRLSSRELSRAPLSGSVFAIEPGISGRDVARFAG